MHWFAVANIFQTRPGSKYRKLCVITITTYMNVCQRLYEHPISVKDRRKQCQDELPFRYNRSYSHGGEVGGLCCALVFK